MVLAKNHRNRAGIIAIVHNILAIFKSMYGCIGFTSYCCILEVNLCLSMEPSDAFARVVTDRHTDRQEFGQPTTVKLAAHAHQGLTST